MPPPDQRRNNGPEISVPYRYHSKINLRTYEDKLNEMLGGVDETKRLDGRKAGEARKIFLKSHVVSQAKGSAYIEMGATKVIVSVFDPREIPKQISYSVIGELYCDFKYAPFSGIVRRLPQTSAAEKSLALSLKRALEAVVCRHEFPNFQVDVFAQVLQDDGSVLGAAITCAGLALADAGIPMFDVVTASTVACLGDRLLLDPTAAEEDLCSMTPVAAKKEAHEGDGGDGVDSGKDVAAKTTVVDVQHGIVMMAHLMALDQVSELWQTGSMRLEMLRAANEMLRDANREAVPIVQQILVRQVLKNVELAKQLEVESLSLDVDELVLGKSDANDGKSVE